ncbi:SgcJ/EcaC family oxidoreductase [Streptomyces sp. NPDC059513]|uniref:SgcJ/EcaC family oxidoreductase n=1 Tax=unclassified Streptomyces TaxID=2593676 RepID=UPI0036C7D978
MTRSGQRDADPEAFLSGFRDDAIWTTARGKRLTGLPEIGAFTRKALPPRAGSPVVATYTVDLILFIRPDVAAVKIRQRPATRDGGECLDMVFRGQENPSELVAAHPWSVPGAPTYVLAKDDGVWRVAAAQNTLVTAPETLAAG